MHAVDEAQHQEPQIWSTRRTLLIGLGSNGLEICDRVVQRVEWELQKWDKVAWVRAFGIETNQGSTFLSEEDRMLITIQQAQYKALVENPSAYQETMGLSSWYDQPTVSAIQDVLTGAGNCRMVGRMAFLYPQNLTAVRERVKAYIETLRGLTSHDATQRFGEALDKSKWKIDLGDGDTAEKFVQVYVVGTLCGGTCSGAFIDFGYMLRDLVRECGYNLYQDAIFTLPHVSYGNTQHVANTFSALTELNHYSSPDSVYEQQMAHKPGRPVRFEGSPPFDHVYLVSSSGSPDTERERLNTAVAQYLYAKVFLQGYAELDAARSNADPHLENMSKYGAPQRYMTFGIASLEYPADQVLRACTSRLCHHAIAAWLSPFEMLDGEVMKRIVEGIGFDVAQVPSKLIECGSDSVAARIGRAIQAACSRVKANSGPLLEFEKKMEAIFERPAGIAKPPEQFESREVYEIVAGRVAELRDEILKDLRGYMERLLFEEAIDDQGGGAYRAECVLNGLRKLLTDRLGAIRGEGSKTPVQQLVDQLLTQMNAVKSEIDTCAHDAALGPALLRGAAIRRLVNQYAKIAKNYYDRRVDDTVQMNGEVPLYQGIIDDVKRLLERLTSQYGLVGQARLVKQHLEKEDNTLSNQHPDIHGTSMFEPGRTVDEEFKAGFDELIEPGSGSKFAKMPLKEAMQEAHKQVLAAWRQLTDDLFRPGRSYFDDPGNEDERKRRRAVPRQRDRDSLMGAAEEILRDVVLKRSVLEMLKTRVGSPHDELKRIFDQSQLLLQVDIADAQHYETGNKAWVYRFSPKADAYPEVAQALQTVEQGILNVKGQDTHDPRRVVFVRERAGFPLGVVAGLTPTMPQYRDKFEEHIANHSATTWSRKGVEWDPIVISKDYQLRRIEAEQLFLVAIACGVLKFGGGMFEYAQTTPGQPLDTLSTSLRTSAHVLMRDNRLRQSIEEDVERAKRLMGAPAFVRDALLKFVNGYPAYDLKLGRIKVDKAYIEDRFLEYCRGDNELRTEWEAARPVVGVDVKDLFKEKGAELPSASGESLKAPVSGCYCPGYRDQPCPQLLMEVDSIDKAEAQRDQLPNRCPRCDKWIHD